MANFPKQVSHFPFLRCDVSYEYNYCFITLRSYKLFKKICGKANIEMITDYKGGTEEIFLSKLFLF